jgi:2-keto-4-pentenoate hydratase
MQMKRAWRFGTVALLALIVASVYAQPPGLAGLVWLDGDIEFDLNAGNLVTTGAITQPFRLETPLLFVSPRRPTP